MKQRDSRKLGTITTFPNLVDYLRDDLGWPIEADDVEEIVFHYEPAELGIDARHAAKINTIRQIRPMVDGQPWGVFFIDFESKKLPVVVMRRILRAFVATSRITNPNQPVWHMNDLLFMTAYGLKEPSQREIAFAHFHQKGGDLPTLRVLGWDGRDTPLKLEHVHGILRQKLCWPDDPEDHEKWRENWSTAFKHRLGHVIRTADALATELASLARRIRDAAMVLLAHETESGPLRTLQKAFQTALINDLSEKDFADTYAQTITYGLLTAAISRTEMSEGRYGTALVAANVADIVPVTNPFLKEMLETFLQAGGREGGIDFDELGIQDVVELLRGEETDLPAILRDFGNRTQGEDPVIHFYEHFLAAYDKELKVQRGVFYTPQPVVSFIVRSVHEMLKAELGLEDGLADTTTWTEMAERFPDIAIPKGTNPENPFVVILDPASGTATFLVEMIEIIYQTMTSKWKRVGLTASQRQAAWNEYVPQHLLPRLYGYELMMAPYAIAHMKIGLKLYETGYRFDSEERVRVYLTNTLEPTDDQMVLSGILPALAHEAEAVNKVRTTKTFTIITGNPPYSYMSANLTETSKAIVEPFRFVDGKRVIERGALVLERALQDDYVKFFAFALRMLENAGVGYIGYISNSAYLLSPQLRGMRSHIKNVCTRFRALDLHGDTKAGLKSDENVFDIRTGVAIAVAEITPGSAGFECAIANLTGSRKSKGVKLDSSTIARVCTDFFEPIPDLYLFRSLTEHASEYANWPSIKEIFPLTGVAIKTNRDHLVIGHEKQEIDQRIWEFTDPNRTTEWVKTKLAVNDNAQWKVADGRIKCRETYSESNYKPLDYRPFDQRWIYYHDSVVFNPRPALMVHMQMAGNIALLSNRRIRTGKHNHFFVTDKLCMAEMLSSADNCNVFPLWIKESSLLYDDSKRPNFTERFLKQLASRLQLPQVGEFQLPVGISARDIFCYAYGVFHSPSYRERYDEELRVDFPSAEIKLRP